MIMLGELNFWSESSRRGSVQLGYYFLWQCMAKQGHPERRRRDTSSSQTLCLEKTLTHFFFCLPKNIWIYTNF